MAPKDPSAIVIPFGKHRGKTVAELLVVDQQYADWVAAQAWVAERFAELHAAIVSRGAGTDDTPEHNALQARFLEDRFVQAFVGLVRSMERSASARELRDTAIYEIGLFQQPRPGWEDISPDRAQQAQKVLAALANGDFETEVRVEFEAAAGVDVVVRHGLKAGNRSAILDKVSVELKPAIGDDYPTVMRQMRRQKCFICVAERYTGRGISEAQLRAMFKANGMKLMFVQEIEERMRI